MTMILIVSAVALVVVPFLCRQWWVSTRKVIYHGTSSAFRSGLDDLSKRAAVDYCWVSVPDGELLLAEIPKERAQRLGRGIAPVTISVVKHAFTKPYVESVKWEDSEAAETADWCADGLVLGLCYALTGLAAIGLAAQWIDTVDGQLALALSGFFLALGGFALNLLHQAGPVNLKGASARVLGIPLGKGLFGLLVLFVICLAIAGFTFSSISIFTLFPGIHAAFAVGSVCALLLRARKTVSD